MATHISHARLPYPVLNARYTLEYVGLDADGDPTDAVTPDTEVSQDGGAFADAAEEVTTITGSNGCGYVTLTGAETNNSLVMVCVKVASGPKATVFSLRPRNLPIVGSGTLSAGSAGGGTLGTVLAYDVTGCFVRTTGGTGGGGTGGANNQARRIVTYVPSTGAFTVSPNWETTPSTDTTYDVLLPEGVTLGMLKALNPTTAGNTLDVTSTGEAGLDWGNVANKTTANALTGTTIAATQKVDLETIKTNPVVNGGTVTFPTNATLASTTNITAGTLTTVTTATNVTTVNGLAAGVITAASIASDALTAAKFAADCITAAKIADGAIDTATFASGCTVPRVTLTDTLTTYTGNTPQTGDAYARIGVAGAGLTAVPWNASWDAEVQSEVQDAIEVNHLDHLLAADYDPASKPGVATALLNELVESDGGVSRYTANALEQAPTGGSAPTAAQIRAEIDANSTQLATIVADTNELQADWANGGRLDLLLDAVKAQADKLSFDASNRLRANVKAVNDVAVNGTGAAGDEWGP